MQYKRILTGYALLMNVCTPLAARDLKNAVVQPLEFDIPAEAAADVVPNLSVFREPATGGADRGNVVAEIRRMRR